MIAKFALLLVATVACGFQSSTSNIVDRKTATKSPDNAPQQSGAQVFALTQKLIRAYSIKEHPYYAPYIVRALSNLVAQYGKAKTNHFYVSKFEEYVTGYMGPWIYWKERRILMTWDQNAGTNKEGELAPEFDLVSWWPRHVYRLDKDLVDGPYANGNDKLTRREATEIIRDCRREGDLFILK